MCVREKGRKRKEERDLGGRFDEGGPPWDEVRHCLEVLHPSLSRIDNLGFRAACYLEQYIVHISRLNRAYVSIPYIEQNSD